MLPYELARRHYLIRRILELEPGTQGYAEIAGLLNDLPVVALLQLFEQAPEIYHELIPLRLLADHYRDFDPTQASPALQKSLEAMYQGFCAPLIQEQERLLQEQKLARYLYARCLLLDEIRFQQSLTRPHMGTFDRDLFRQYLSGYRQILRGGIGNPHLLDLWHECGWLSRWQLGGDLERHPLPVQLSPRLAIAKYKLSETGKRLYAEMEQGITHQDSFLDKLPSVIERYLSDCSLRFNDRLEPSLRQLVQVTLRHGVKKSFRIPRLTTLLLQQIAEVLTPQTVWEQHLLFYTAVQEILLGTQNLKYRLNDAMTGMAQALASLSLSPSVMVWVEHAILDTVMEIYESFSLADNALKSFLDQYQQALEEREHQQFQELQAQLLTLLASD